MAFTFTAFYYGKFFTLISHPTSSPAYNAFLEGLLTQRWRAYVFWKTPTSFASIPHTFGYFGLNYQSFRIHTDIWLSWIWLKFLIIIEIGNLSSLWRVHALKFPITFLTGNIKSIREYFDTNYIITNSPFFHLCL